VTGGKEFYFVAFLSDSLAKIQTEKLVPLILKSRFDETPRSSRTDCFFMGSKMICVGMGNKSQIPRVMRIKPKTWSYQLGISFLDPKIELGCRGFYQ
tara:strand:- start:36 stop:326 length:291 start_codon:yes stop_codon:yes gene_type:complete